MGGTFDFHCGYFDALWLMPISLFSVWTYSEKDLSVRWANGVSSTEMAESLE